MFDSEKAAEFIGEECVALIKIMEFNNRLKDMRYSRFTSMAAMTAWSIWKKQKFYNGLTEGKGGVGVKADAVFYIAQRWKILHLCGILHHRNGACGL